MRVMPNNHTKYVLKQNQRGCLPAWEKAAVLPEFIDYLLRLEIGVNSTTATMIFVYIKYAMHVSNTNGVLI